MNRRVLRRLVQIQRVFVRHGLDDFFRGTSLEAPLRYANLAAPWTWFEERLAEPRAARLRLALEDLGPIFVKFGQALSTRRDLLPPDIADELAKLQDRVPPFPGAVARVALERSYGRPLDEVFSAFEETPLAAASIAQVHVAKLGDGQEVVVKLLRPGMRAAIDQDIEVLYTLARLAERYWTGSARLRPVEVVREYEKTILDELDLMREAGNASQLRRNFEGSNLLYVPKVYWDLCRVDVMVMERIHGIQISDMTQLRALGTNIRALAVNGVEIFFTQVFRHNFFHADMHPGNIFVLADDPQHPRYAAVDFGIVGTLDPRDQNYLAENFLAVFDRNYRRVAELHVESGWVPPGTRVDEMESAIRTVCEPIFQKPLKDISFGMVLLRLFEISRRFEMPVQPQLILLQKTLLNIEGLGRELDPDLDIWQTAGPILREWMRERTSLGALAGSVRENWPLVMETLRALPPLVRSTVLRAQEDRLAFKVQSDELAALRESARASRRAQLRAIYGGAALLGGLIWLAIGRDPAWPGWLLVAGSLVGAWSARRRG